MSNFLRVGKRIEARKKKKDVKHITKEFYKTLGELDDVAETMKSNVEVMKDITAENIVEKAQMFTDREIGSMEKMVLMGKLGLYEAMEKTVQRDTKTGKPIIDEEQHIK